jgi:excisionase family DNA binding protein
MKTHGGTTDNRRLLTTKEAAALWGISPWTLREMVKRGEVKRVMGLRTKEFRFLQIPSRSFLIAEQPLTIERAWSRLFLGLAD